MGREPVEDEILGLKVTSLPLPFPTAQELLPEVAEFLSRAARELGAALSSGIKKTDDVVKLIPLINPGEFRELMAAINRRAAQLLSCTSVVMPDVAGELKVWELRSEKDRNYVFGERPDAYIPVAIFAGKVTFSRFFPVSVPSAVKTPEQ